MRAMGVSLLLFKQETAFEMRMSDWSSDVCSSDLSQGRQTRLQHGMRRTTSKALVRMPVQQNHHTLCQGSELRRSALPELKSMRLRQPAQEKEQPQRQITNAWPITIETGRAS